MAQPNSLDALLLIALDRGGPDYGFRLIERLAAVDEDFRPSASGLYPALQRLESGGFATTKEVPAPADRGGRPRRIYAITAKGRRRAQQLARFFLALSTKAAA